MARRVVLVVYGVRSSGRREVIDFRVARSESAQEWGMLLWSIYRRGLKDEDLRLVTVEGGKGLLAATAEVSPDVVVQWCWFHKLRKRTPPMCTFTNTESCKRIVFVSGLFVKCNRQ